MRSHPGFDGAMPFVWASFRWHIDMHARNTSTMCSLRCVKQPPEGCMALAHSEMLNLQDHNTYANLDMQNKLHELARANRSPRNQTNQTRPSSPAVESSEGVLSGGCPMQGCLPPLPP